MHGPATIHKDNGPAPIAWQKLECVYLLDIYIYRSLDDTDLSQLVPLY